MNEEKTTDIEKRINDLTYEDIDNYYKEVRGKTVDNEHWYYYVSDIIVAKHFRKKTVLQKADIDAKYGYKLLNGEASVGKKRDIIIRIAYGALFSVTELNRALKLAGFNELYVKNGRDALIYIIFNNRVGDKGVEELNQILEDKGFAPLDTVGKED